MQKKRLPKSSETRFFKFSAVITACIVVFIILTVLAMKYANQKNIVTSMPKHVENEEFYIQMIENKEKEINTIVTHPAKETNYKPITLQYPDSWILEEEVEGFNLQKGQYTFSLSHPGIGGGVCLFSDTDLTKIDEYWARGEIAHEYVEIPFDNGVFRRTKVENFQDSQTDSNLIVFKVCEKLSIANDPFEIPINGGVISYTVPKNPDPLILKEMDLILSSLTYSK